MRERVAFWTKKWKEWLRKRTRGRGQTGAPDHAPEPVRAQTGTGKPFGSEGDGRRHGRNEKTDQEHAKLLEDLRTAHLEWEIAQRRLDYVLDEDEIDYAIFALETAEKRYGMLLKQAKAMRVRAEGFPVSTPPVRLSAKQ